MEIHYIRIMISEIISTLAIIYLGLPVILIAYLIKRKNYVNRYAGTVTRHVERVNYVVVEDGPLEALQYAEHEPEFEVNDADEVMEETAYVSAGEEIEEDELVQREVVAKAALQPASADTTEKMEGKMPIATVKELVAQEEVPEEAIASEAAAIAGAGGVAVKEKKKVKIPVLVKAALIAVPLWVAYNGFKQASEADRKLKELDELPLLPERTEEAEVRQSEPVQAPQGAAEGLSEEVKGVKAEDVLTDAGGEAGTDANEAANGTAERQTEAQPENNNEMLDLAASRERIRAAREARRKKAEQREKNEAGQMDFSDVVGDGATKRR